MPIPHPNWNDIDSNSRDQLIQMLKDLEVPYFDSATNNELKQIISFRLNPTDKVAEKKVKEIFTTTRYKKRTIVTKNTKRFLTFFVIIFAFFISANRITAPFPYCDSGIENAKCRKCPINATCEKGKAKCPKGEFLSQFGCRPYEYKKLYKHAMRASKFISRRDGDCIDKLDPIPIERFNILFPDIDVSIFDIEQGFGVSIINSTLVSNNPQSSFVCKTITWMEKYPNIVGPIVIFLSGAIIYYIYHAIKNRDIEEAKKLAKLAHKILATTDKQIYMYDMKVQLRAKNSRIDRLWKSVVKYIENDSHVIVGVMGARHEVYWKWIHHE